MDYSYLLHKKMENYSIEIHKQISTTEEPKQFRKIVPIREGIIFSYIEEDKEGSELSLFCINAV